MTSQRGQAKIVAHETKSSASLMFLPRCDFLCANLVPGSLLGAPRLAGEKAAAGHVSPSKIIPLGRGGLVICQ